MKSRFFPATISLVLSAVVFFALLCGNAAADISYVENDLNFVDGALDVSHGLPPETTGVLERIKRSGVLRVATEPYFVPQEFIDRELTGQDQYAGADMELARLIAKRMGVKLEIVPMPFTDVLPALSEDRCDLTISALAFTPARAGSYTLSKGYYFSGKETMTAFVIRQEDAEKITSVSDLADKVIVAQSSSLQEAMAALHVYDYKEFRRLPSVQAVYEAVHQGRADAGAVEVENATKYMENNPDSGLVLAQGISYALEPDYRGYRIAAKKGEYQLMYFVNGVINEVLENGSYEQWVDDALKRAGELGL